MREAIKSSFVFSPSSLFTIISLSFPFDIFIRNLVLNLEELACLSKIKLKIRTVYFTLLRENKSLLGWIWNDWQNKAVADDLRGSNLESSFIVWNPPIYILLKETVSRRLLLRYEYAASLSDFFIINFEGLLWSISFWSLMCFLHSEVRYSKDSSLLLKFRLGNSNTMRNPSTIQRVQKGTKEQGGSLKFPDLIAMWMGGHEWGFPPHQ